MAPAPDLLFTVTALGIASTLSPGILAIALALLSGKHYPMKRSLAFLAGMLPTVLIIAAAGAGLFAFTSASRDSQTSAYIDLAIGALFLLFAILPWVWKGKDASASQIKEAAAPSQHLGRWFLVGFVATITNFDAVLLYFTEVKEIANSSALFLSKLLLSALGALFFLLPALLPILVAIAYPKKAEKMLKPVRALMEKYGNYLVSLIMLAFGAYFLYRSHFFF
ncbi:Sap, sulfolipid-1-addressing protein [Candidatus Anstonella stagnisolia]|nr:Sap, sulfolipid-1-addressing protein [Candidatus Anstonella stagnisolia]